MSEFQTIHFAAVDKALDDKQLAYMEQQSSRAEVSRWLFEVEYRYSDFRGNAVEMMRRVLDGDAAAVRAESLADIREHSGATTWPVAEGTRTLAELRELASGKATTRRKREETAQQRQREKRLEELRGDPASAIKEAEKLVETRSTDNYCKAAKVLAELRDAMQGDAESKRSDRAAQRLAKKYPTLSYLKRAFKTEGLNYK